MEEEQTKKKTLYVVGHVGPPDVHAEMLARLAHLDEEYLDVVPLSGADLEALYPRERETPIVFKVRPELAMAPMIFDINNGEPGRSNRRKARKSNRKKKGKKKYGYK